MAMLRFRESTAYWFWMLNLHLIRLGCLTLNFNLFICKIKVKIITFGGKEIDKYFLILNHFSKSLQLIILIVIIFCHNIQSYVLLKFII